MNKQRNELSALFSKMYDEERQREPDKKGFVIYDNTERRWENEHGSRLYSSHESFKAVRSRRYNKKRK